MKKTLITMMLMGGIAVGAGTQTSLDTGNTTSTKSLVITSAITLTNLDTIVDNTGTNITLLSIKSGSGDSWGIGVGTWNSNQILVATTAKGGEAITDSNKEAFTWYGADGTTIDAPQLNNTFDNLENAVGAAITLGYQTWRVSDDSTTTADVTGTAVVFSVRYADGSTKSIYGHKSNYANGGTHVPTMYYDSSLLDTPTITESSSRWTSSSLIAANEFVLPAVSVTPSVPEPTTATLSLLALAGLCARRRRH